MDVADALARDKPVDPLEITIFTHGMPFPDNIEMASSVEREIWASGAIAATITVINGRFKIGLSTADLDPLAHVKDAFKISRADIAFAIAQGKRLEPQ